MYFRIFLACMKLQKALNPLEAPHQSILNPLYPALAHRINFLKGFKTTKAY